MLEDATELGLADPLHRNFGLKAKGPAVGSGVAAKDLPALSKDIGAYRRGADGHHDAAGPQLAPPPPRTNRPRP